MSVRLTRQQLRGTLADSTGVFTAQVPAVVQEELQQRQVVRPAPQAFAESVKYAEANLCSRASELVGDRNPREHEFSIQLRAFDTSKTGSSLGVAALLAICSALINKSLRGGMVVLGGINLGGSIDPLHNAIDVVELVVEKGASVVLMPVSSRKQLFDLSDDIATKVTVVFYNDAREALIKAISD